MFLDSWDVIGNYWTSFVYFRNHSNHFRVWKKWNCKRILCSYLPRKSFEKFLFFNISKIWIERIFFINDRLWIILHNCRDCISKLSKNKIKNIMINILYDFIQIMK